MTFYLYFDHWHLSVTTPFWNQCTFKHRHFFLLMLSFVLFYNSSTYDKVIARTNIILSKFDL